MPSEIIVALIAGLGTLIDTFGGILASNRLVNHRLHELEKKVDKHNHLVERMAVVERDLKTAFHKLDDIKGEIRH